MTRVVVCGAGPAGATLAATLARRGITTTLVERHRDLSREFRGEWLTPGGQRALEQMGFGALMASLPSVGAPRTKVHIGGRYRFSTGGSADPQTAAKLIPQPLLLGSIIDQASSLPSFEYLDGAIVRDVVKDDGRVSGVVVDRGGTTSTLTADFVFGTDGRTSVIRRKLGYLPPSSATSEAYDVVWFNLPGPRDGEFEYEGHLFLDPGSTLFFHPYPGHLLQFGFVVDKHSFGEMRRRADGAWWDDLAKRLPEPFATHVRRHAPDAQPALLDVTTFLLDRWDTPGALLIGDAAHAMSPVGGQGINLALRDVVVTLNHLTRPLLSGDLAAIDAAAASVRAERLPEVVRIQQLQHRGAQILHQRTRASRFLISRVAPVLSKVGGPLLDRGIGTTKEFSNGVTQVALQPH